jgi:hypothetical protein
MARKAYAVASGAISILSVAGYPLHRHQPRPRGRTRLQLPAASWNSLKRRVDAPETTWTGFSNRILGDSNGLRYIRQPPCIMRVSTLTNKGLVTQYGLR